MTLDDLIPTSVRSLLPPVALGLGIAVLLYVGMTIVLTTSVDASSTHNATVEEDLPASQVVTRFAAAMVAGDRDAMARYAAADVVDDIYPDASAEEAKGPAEAVAHEVRRHVAERGLLRLDIEGMGPHYGGMFVDAVLHVFDPAHFERWADYDPAYKKALDEAIAEHAAKHTDTEIDVHDRTANLLIIAEAGANAFEAVQTEMSSVMQSYIDDFFNAFGSDAEYMFEPLPATTFLLERRSGHWLIVAFKERSIQPITR